MKRSVHGSSTQARGVAGNMHPTQLMRNACMLHEMLGMIGTLEQFTHTHTPAGLDNYCSTLLNKSYTPEQPV